MGVPKRLPECHGGSSAHYQSTVRSQVIERELLTATPYGVFKPA